MTAGPWLRACFKIRRGPVFGQKAEWHDEGTYPPAGAARGHHGATKPDGLLPENPPGGGSFARGRRWLVPYSPLRALRAAKAALATAKIPHRRPPANFKTGSKAAITTDQVGWKQSVFMVPDSSRFRTKSSPRRWSC